ncbi:MAG: division/cell wall cluster transcriptional repressor MraZ, partial [Cytophagales bacterium]|nr:division/cell wall cluster transcriptional repressor MraZ [Cytophagales bacterium]
MVLFSGEYLCKIDAKGRLSLPAKVKANLPVPFQKEVVLRRSTDPCLVVYTQIGFQKLASKVSALNEFDSRQRKLQRSFFGSVSEVSLDSAGRVLVPRKMLEYASLEKEGVIVGLGDRLEIWNPKAYRSVQDED